MKNMPNKYVIDVRWNGSHGIGRFSKEIISRFESFKAITKPKKPLSLLSTISLPFYLPKKNAVFFTPGFNPPLYSSIPFIFTIHDLTHLKIKNSSSILKKIYYNFIIKQAAKRAFKILTVSNFSKNEILHWLNLTEDKVIVVGCGASNNFSINGDSYNMGYPYIFCLGNLKPHKNIIRTIEAFAKARIDHKYKLLIAGIETSELRQLANTLGINDRVIFHGPIAENELANFYRGANIFIFASLSEGFGLPIIEAMSCGVPVITSNISAMPEVSGGAALLVDPYNVDSISAGIETLINNDELRKDFIAKGLENVKRYTWDKTTNIIKQVLDEALQII